MVGKTQTYVKYSALAFFVCYQFKPIFTTMLLAATTLFSAAKPVTKEIDSCEKYPSDIGTVKK